MNNPTEIARIGAEFMRLIDQGVLLKAIAIAANHPQLDILDLLTLADVETFDAMLLNAQQKCKSVRVQRKLKTVQERLGGLWGYCAACGTFSRKEYSYELRDLPYSAIGNHVCVDCAQDIIGVVSTGDGVYAV